MSKLKDEQMEQDALIEYSTRFLYFYRNNKGAVIGTGVGILLAIGLTIGYFVWNMQQESEAEILLGQAQEYYMEGDLERSLYGDDERAEPGFLHIADNFSRTRSGNLAQYYSAVLLADIGEYERAIDYINRFSVPEGILGIPPITLHASILAELERYDEAARRYLDAAEWAVNETTTPANLLEASIAFETAGNEEQAIRQLERILDEYPDSQQAGEAERRLGRLTAGR